MTASFGKQMRTNITRLPQAPLALIFEGLEQTIDRIALASTCKKLCASAGSSWSSLSAELFLPEHIQALSQWPKLPQATSMHLAFFGGGESSQGSPDDTCFVDPITRLLRAVSSCSGLTSLELSAGGGMAMPPLRIHAKQLHLPALERLVLSGPLSIDLEVQHLSSLSEMRLGLSASPGLKRPIVRLPTTLRTLTLPPEDGLPAFLGRPEHTHLRSVGVGSALGIVAQTTLKRLTMLSNLDIGDRLPTAQQAALSKLTNLDSLGLAGELDTWRVLLPLQQLSMLSLRRCAALSTLPAELAALPCLKVLDVGDCPQLASFAPSTLTSAVTNTEGQGEEGEGDPLGVEDLTLCLDAASRLAPQLPSCTPSLRTLRLVHGRGPLDEAATAKLGTVLSTLAGNRPTGLERLVLCWMLSGVAGGSKGLQGQLEVLGRGAGSRRGVGVRRMEYPNTGAPRVV